MAVRQYIGARYVPKFYEGSNGSQWDSGVQYEPLTIVQYLTNTYCSKKTIPSTVGAPNLNPDYWANIGMLSDVQSDIAQLQSDVSGLDTRVHTLETSVSGLDSELDDAEANVTNNTKLINAVKRKNIIAIADSYGVASADWDATKSFLQITKERLSYSDTQYYWKAQAGAGFANGLFLSNLQSVTPSRPQDITDIYFFGGWNDEIGRTEITVNPITEQMVTDAMDTVRQYCYTNYPNATVHICFIAWRFGATIPSTLLATRRIYLGAGVRGYSTHFNAQYILHNKIYMGRGEYYDHPNQSGHVALADSFVRIITTGDCDVYNSASWSPSDLSLATNMYWNASADTFALSQWLYNSVITNDLFVAGDNLLFKHQDSSLFSLAMDGNDYIELFSYSGGVSTGQDMHQGIPVYCTLISSTEVLHVNAFIVLQNGKAYLHLPYYTETPNAAPTAKSIGTFIISRGVGAYSANLS